MITGGDSGIGRAVALAYAREGADVLISYLDEEEDAKETQRLVVEAGRKAVLVSGDIQHAAHCREIIDRAVQSSVALIFLSTTRRIRRASKTLQTSPMRSGS